MNILVEQYDNSYDEMYYAELLDTINQKEIGKINEYNKKFQGCKTKAGLEEFSNNLKYFKGLHKQIKKKIDRADVKKLILRELMSKASSIDLDALRNKKSESKNGKKIP